MKNDPEMMAVADKYMTEYMSGPVHEVNKITAKKNRLTKSLQIRRCISRTKRKSIFA